MMNALSAQELLTVWERYDSQTPARRSLGLLIASEPETAVESLTNVSVGERDRRLLTLREWAFGPRLTSRASCPKCAEQAELDFATADLRTQALPVLQPLTMNVEGYEIAFRVVTAADLEAISHERNEERAKRILLDRCLLKVTHKGVNVSTQELPEHIIGRLEAQLEQADPGANIELQLECPACRHTWAQVFDVVQYFWQEIHAWAVRLLREVHTLASAYGWTEADVLSMSPMRRRLYMEMQA